MSPLQGEDRHIDRCETCGAWRWKTQCKTCGVSPALWGAITQDGMPPYRMHCHACGLTWEPPNARGKDHPTEASLDRETKRHLDSCPAKPKAL